MAACQASLSFTTSWSLLKLMSIEPVMPSNHLILCHPLLLLPSIFPAFKVFSNESAFCIRWPKYWNISFGINPSNEYSQLIFCRIGWFDLLAVQGTLKSLLQHQELSAPFCRAWLVATLAVYSGCLFWACLPLPFGFWTSLFPGFNIPALHTFLPTCSHFFVCLWCPIDEVGPWNSPGTWHEGGDPEPRTWLLHGLPGKAH